MATTTHIRVNNVSNAQSMGLSYRYLFAFEQVEYADNNNNYSAWIYPLPFLAKYASVDIIITRDNFIFQSRQCVLKGELTDDGLTLYNFTPRSNYFYCEVVGSATHHVTINVYQI